MTIQALKDRLKNLVTFKNPKLVALIAGGIILVVGGSAAAYYGVVVPNKPENVLKQAVENTLKQKQTAITGKVSVEDTSQDATVKAANILVNGQLDLQKSAYQLGLDVTASGVKIPVELVGIDKDFYIKLGDLSAAQALAAQTNPEAAAILGLFQKISNKWIVADETLLKQTKLDCALGGNYTLSDKDIQTIVNHYQQAQFATIKKTSNDTVNGRAAIKYDLELDSQKAQDYSKGLNDLDIVKKVNACRGNSQSEFKPVANRTTPVTLWVDKATKTVAKISGQTTPQDQSQKDVKGSYELNFSYNKVDIKKPEGATPLTQVLGELLPLYQQMTPGLLNSQSQ